jgi:uncharacterized membrane protein YdbT with pleckstrin-like domain
MSSTHQNQVPDWVELTEGENKIWTGRPSLLMHSKNLAIGSVIIIGSIVLFFEIPAQFSWRPFVLLATLPGLLIIVGTIMWHQTYKYILTTDEIYLKKGMWPMQQIQNFRLDRIQHTEVARTAVQGLMSYGDVTLATAGTGQVEFALQWIPNPEKLNRTIAGVLDEAPTPGPAPNQNQSADPF